MKIFSAKVIAGEGRGRTIGFPTANLDKTDLGIDFGVYAARAHINEREFAALLHFGPQKTFAGKISTELHLKDFIGDIYGQEVRVEIIAKIREIRKFESVYDLQKQIQIDLKSI